MTTTESKVKKVIQVDIDPSSRTYQTLQGFSQDQEENLCHDVHEIRNLLQTIIDMRQARQNEAFVSPKKERPPPTVPGFIEPNPNIPQNFPQNPYPSPYPQNQNQQVPPANPQQNIPAWYQPNQQNPRVGPNPYSGPWNPRNQPSPQAGPNQKYPGFDPPNQQLIIPQAQAVQNRPAKKPWWWT